MMRIALICLCVFGLVVGEVEKPVFRILAPQFLCDAPSTKGKKNGSEIAPPSQITIGMQTKGGQKLRFVVSIFFDIINGFQNQQHTLKIWRSIRMLEKKIKKNERNISENNQIDIDNKELTTGVVYTFCIIGIDENGVSSEQQNFTVTFKNGVASTAIQQDGMEAIDGVSLVLIGAEITYADVEYLVEAQVTLCNPTNDLHFKWEMKNIPEQYAKITTIKGKLFRIPPNVLDRGKEYEIVLKLMKTSDSFLIAQAKIKLRVLLRGFDVAMVPFKTVVGVDREIQLKMIINDNDNYKDQTIEWSCVDSGKKACDLFEPSKTAVQIMRLFAIGVYTVQASVKIHGETKTQFSTLVAENDIISNVRFDNYPNKPLIAGNKFKVDAIIYDLIPNCFAQWDVVNEKGFSYFDTQNFPTRLGQLLVHNVEENFLSELVDYGNDTLEREITLSVPAANEVPEFKGLESNTKYKFRLTTICPKPVTDVNSKAPRANTTAYTDVVLETNGPPKGQPMEVEPSSGEALRTRFKFSTGVASDIATDFPLKYSFFYTIESYTLKIGEYYESMLASSELPYSKTPIQTSYEVCDSREACSIVKGPTVTTTLVGPMSKKEAKFRIEQINTEMQRMEYDSAFEKAIATMLTSKHFNDTTFSNQLQSSMVKAIETEISRLKVPATERSFYVTDATLLIFVKMSKMVLNIMQVSDDAITSDLLHLVHETVTSGGNDTINRIKRAPVEQQERSNRMTDEMETIKVALSLSENLMNSSNKTTVAIAKVKLRDDVHQYVERMCHRADDEVFDAQYVKFQTNPKVSARQLSTMNLTIPFSSSPLKSVVQLGFAVDSDLSKKLCVGKLLYPTDLLSNDGSATYELVVLEEMAGKFEPKALKTDSDNVMISLLKPTSGNSSSYLSFKCAIWANKQWMTNLCKTVAETDLQVDCKCSQIGYFKLTPSNPVTNEHLLASTVPSLPASTTMPPVMAQTTPSITTSVPSPEVMQDSSTNNRFFSQTGSEFVARSTPFGGIISGTDIDPVRFPGETTTPVTSAKPQSNTEKPQLSTKVTVAATTNATNIFKSSTGSNVAYLIVGSGVSLIGLTAILVYWIRRRRNFAPIPSNISILNIDPRQPQPGIRYARFHDEHLMRGDIFDTTA